AVRWIDRAADDAPRHRTQRHSRGAAAAAQAARRQATGDRQMIAAWMLYCSLCALGLGAAAALAERLLLAGRAPVRVGWIAALVSSLIVRVLAFQFSSSPVAVPATVPVVVDEVTPPIAVDASHVVVTAPLPKPAEPPKRDWSSLTRQLDQ